MKNPTTQKVFELINKELVKQFKNNKAEAARKIKVERQSFSTSLKRMDRGSGISYIHLKKILNGLGYDIEISKKKLS